MTNPNQSNVTAITDKQPQPTAKFSITASLDGFPIVIEGEGRAGDLKIIIDRLKAIGAEPPSVSANFANSQNAEPAKKSAPVCPDHGTVMKASRRPGQFYCPRALPDGGYCNQKA